MAELIGTANSFKDGLLSSVNAFSNEFQYLKVASFPTTGGSNATFLLISNNTYASGFAFLIDCYARDSSNLHVYYKKIYGLGAEDELKIGYKEENDGLVLYVSRRSVLMRILCLVKSDNTTLIYEGRTYPEDAISAVEI